MLLKNMKDKRGAELTIGTLIIIILGIVVLVFLILGFTLGWENLFGKLTEWLGGGKSNIDDIAFGCNTACQSAQKFAFCDQERELKGADGKAIFTGSGITCANLAESGLFGINKCPALDCSPTQIRCSSYLSENSCNTYSNKKCQWDRDKKACEEVTQEQQTNCNEANNNKDRCTTEKPYSEDCTWDADTDECKSKGSNN